MLPDSPARDLLRQDYVTFHLVLVVGGAAVTIALAVTSAKMWRARRHLPSAGSAPSVRRAAARLSLISALTSVLFALLVAVNLGTVIQPQPGFAAITDTASADPTLRVVVTEWAESGSVEMPQVLQQRVSDRLSWQLPKAVVCALLLGLLVMVDVRLWRKLVTRSSQPGSIHRQSFFGVLRRVIRGLTVPITGLLLVMTLANAQAVIAPVTITVLYG
jgi:hypothetical protein